jgi:hypothetical protein
MPDLSLISLKRRATRRPDKKSRAITFWRLKELSRASRDSQ